MTFSTPRYLTKKDAVAESIRNRILNEELKPGVQLLQDEVAKQLGVSSTPVREAFSVLEAEGFVARQPHKGVVVARRGGLDDLAQIFELRAVLEERAVNQLIARRDRDLSGLDKAVKDADRAAGAANSRLLQLANSNFHLALVQAAGSQVLLDVMAVLVPRSRLFVLKRADMVRARKEHQRILAAIRRGDADEARRVLSKHLRTFVQVVRSASRKPRASAARR
jgi:DNA-binding GntR family transcriptional regulator